jgi:hypothetical protein
MRSFLGLISLLIIITTLPGCVGPCSAPVVLMPFARLLKQPEEPAIARPVDPADLPPDVALNPQNIPIDIRPADH